MKFIANYQNKIAHLQMPNYCCTRKHNSESMLFNLIVHFGKYHRNSYSFEDDYYKLLLIVFFGFLNKYDGCCYTYKSL